jgi:hypothetical protein
MHIIYIYTLYKYIHCFSRPKGSSSEASPALSRHSAHSELVIPGWAKKQGSWQALTEAEKNMLDCLVILLLSNVFSIKKMKTLDC